jgi:2-polyprenyl-3-methyl-5-hydroxy-6-metoxy-1,4-benzoquinol methylase
MYDKEYYESNNYTNYLAREDRYLRLANEIIEYLSKMNLVKSPVLDFGCAVGFLLKAFEKHNLDCYGVDVSDWALTKAKESGLNVSKEVLWEKQHALVTALDVLEHMSEDDLRYFMANINTNAMVFRMPIVANEGEDYVLEVSRVDPTHNIRWTKQQWEQFFNQYGYVTVDLNLNTIYNSDGVYAGVAIKYVSS